MFKSFKLIAATTVSALAIATGAYAASHTSCEFTTDEELKSLSAAFEAWKVVTEAMAACAPNYVAELDQEFKTKQVAAFEADPSLYEIGGVANATLVPLLDGNLIRPLDDLVEKYGQDLNPNQLIKIDGKTMAIAFMVNAQHLMYREDILSDLGIEVPTTWDEVIEASQKIQEAGVVEYPLGATTMTGWNLGEEFINMYLGFGGELTDPSTSEPSVNNEAGVKALEKMKELVSYLDPEYLSSDSTTVQQQFQQGKIAMANLWASRANAMEDEAESQVVGKVKMAAAPIAEEGMPPASTLWWDGFVIAKNISDEKAEAAFQLAMEGIKAPVIEANNDAAVWLAKGFTPGDLAMGAAATAQAGAPSYPASAETGLMHTAAGDNIADFLTGSESAEQTLSDIEESYRSAAREQGILQ